MRTVLSKRVPPEPAMERPNIAEALNLSTGTVGPVPGLEYFNCGETPLNRRYVMGLKDDSKASEDQAADLANRAIDNARGRKDKGQEGVPDKKKLEQALPGVAKVLLAKQEADEAYSKKVKAAAKSCGFMANIVRAAAKEMLSEPEGREMAMRYAEQLELALSVVEKLKK